MWSKNSQRTSAAVDAVCLRAAAALNKPVLCWIRTRRSLDFGSRLRFSFILNNSETVLRKLLITYEISGNSSIIPQTRNQLPPARYWNGATSSSNSTLHNVTLPLAALMESAREESSHRKLMPPRIRRVRWSHEIHGTPTRCAPSE